MPLPVVDLGGLQIDVREYSVTDQQQVEQYKSANGNFWVAVLSNDPSRVVGAVGLGYEAGGIGLLRRMSVASEFQRMGIGRQLVLHLEHWARNHQFVKIRLITRQEMLSSHKFYESLGYARTKSFPAAPGLPVVMFEFSKHLR
ncbi:TPA: hypothetical protein N0F65_012399 [Lagenidium giganteum]|uniref:N-acetyltransferase domain-containing protein n=1 Tax=Lagenidium giganteum TaxID=4803 RepID=A0AAV2YRT7_9STRA|nr:TPA: hypothetical protein N0F65_012399 [Lagenidium giganteum]